MCGCCAIESGYVTNCVSRSPTNTSGCPQLTFRGLLHGSPCRLSLSATVTARQPFGAFTTNKPIFLHSDHTTSHWLCVQKSYSLTC